MDLPHALLGATAVRRLQETQAAAVLEIGSDRFTREDLARVACFNFQAARLLTTALAALKIPNLRHLYEHVAPAQLALPHLGVVSLAVLGAAFEVKGIGGETPLASYAARHAGPGRPMSFPTYKLRETARARQLRRGRFHPRRKAS